MSTTGPLELADFSEGPFHRVWFKPSRPRLVVEVDIPNHPKTLFKLESKALTSKLTFAPIPGSTKSNMGVANEVDTEKLEAELNELQSLACLWPEIFVTVSTVLLKERASFNADLKWPSSLEEIYKIHPPSVSDKGLWEMHLEIPEEGEPCCTVEFDLAGTIHDSAHVY